MKKILKLFLLGTFFLSGIFGAVPSRPATPNKDTSPYRVMYGIQDFDSTVVLRDTVWFEGFVPHITGDTINVNYLTADTVITSAFTDSTSFAVSTRLDSVGILVATARDSIDYLDNRVTPVNRGGTGLSTLTANTLYKGNGTSAMAVSGITDDGTTATIDREIDNNGKYIVDSQSITNLASIGAGYLFDGVDDRILVGLLSTPSEFSIAGIFYKEDATETFILGNYGRAVLYYSTNSPHFRYYSDGTTLTSSIYNMASAFGKWNHFVLTHSSDNSYNFYLNGILVLSGTDSGINTSYTSSYLGNAGVTYYEIGYKSYAHFNKALTATEVKDLYSNANVPYKYEGASQTDLLGGEGAFGSDAVDNAAFNAAYTNMSVSTTGCSVSVASGVVDMAMTATASKYLQLSSGLIPGKKYKLSNVNVSARNGIWKISNTQSLADPGYYLITGAGLRDYEFIAIGTNLNIIGYTSGDSIQFDQSGITMTLTQKGCVADYSPEGVGHNQWTDNSGNGNHGTVSGALPTGLPANHVETYENTLTTNTNITLPAGYVVSDFWYYNTSSDASSVSAYFEASDTCVAKTWTTTGDVGTLPIVKGCTQLADDILTIAVSDTIKVCVKMEKIDH